MIYIKSTLAGLLAANIIKEGAAVEPPGDRGYERLPIAVKEEHVMPACVFFGLWSEGKYFYISKSIARCEYNGCFSLGTGQNHRPWVNTCTFSRKAYAKFICRAAPSEWMISIARIAKERRDHAGIDGYTENFFRFILPDPHRLVPALKARYAVLSGS